MPDDSLKPRRLQSNIVYVVVAMVPHRVVKIGVTCKLEQRLYSINWGVPFEAPCEVFFSLEMTSPEDAVLVERMTHLDHMGRRIKGEWFDVDPEEAKASIIRHSQNPDLAEFRRADFPMPPQRHPQRSWKKPTRRKRNAP